MAETSETVIETAQQVKAVVQEADPTKQLEQQAKEKMREEMRATMTEMEAARDRVGNYCVTIGDGDKRAVMLLEPMILVDHSSGIGADHRSTSDITHRLYVYAIEDGFRAMNFTTGVSNEVIEPLSGKSLSPQQIEALKQQTRDWAQRGSSQERQMLDMLRQAKDGKVGEDVRTKLELYRGPYLTSNIDERRDPYCYGYTQQISGVSDGTFVMEALGASIKATQERHQIGLNASTNATQIAGAVRSGLPK